MMYVQEVGVDERWKRWAFGTSLSLYNVNGDPGGIFE